MNETLQPSVSDERDPTGQESTELPMRILVSGASSQIGHFLLPLLHAQNHQVWAISRFSQPAVSGVHWLRADLRDDPSLLWSKLNVDVWIHLGFLAMILPHLAIAKRHGIRKVIAFSSTSVLTKKNSANPQEQHMIAELQQAEYDMQKYCQQYGLGWTIFRPTMIYGCGKDKNISFIAQRIRRFGCFPIIGQGKGLRQPVHAEDLAIACVQVLALNCNQIYTLSGAEVLSYRTMVERVFIHQGKRPRFIRLPLTLFRVLIRVLKLLPSYQHLTMDMADRMDKDMVFSYQEASKDFAYRPRKFEL